MAKAEGRNKTGKLPEEQSEAWVSRESILLRALGDLLTDDTTPVEEVLLLIHSFKVAKAKGVPVHLAKVTGSGELLLDDGLTSEITTAASTVASTACEDTQFLHRHEKLCNGLSCVAQRGNELDRLGKNQNLSKQDELLRCCFNDHTTTRSRTSQTMTGYENNTQSTPMKEVFATFQSVECNNGFVDSSFDDSIYTNSSDSSEDSSIASGNSAGSFKTSTSMSCQSSPSAACSLGTNHRYTQDMVSPRTCGQLTTANKTRGHRILGVARYIRIHQREQPQPHLSSRMIACCL